MRGQNKVTGLEVGGQRGQESQGNQKQDTKLRELGVPGVLRAAVKGPLGSRNVREIGHWESLGNSH